MPRSTTVHYTYDDHRSIPEDHRRHEIVDGGLRVTPTPRFNHQVVAADLLAILRDLTREHDLGEAVGPVTVHLADDLVLEPDLIFVRASRLDIVDPEGDVHGAPDLVVEVLSPSTRDYDRGLKRKRYLESGVTEVWLVDVDPRSVEVWRAGDAEPVTEREAVRWQVGGRTFEVPVADVFRGVR